MIRPVFRAFTGGFAPPLPLIGEVYRALPPAVLLDEPVRPTDEIGEHKKQRSSARRRAAPSIIIWLQ